MSGDLDDFDELVDPSYRNARIVMYAAVRSSRDSAELRRQLVSLGNAHFPDQSIEVLSTEILLSQAADALVSEQALSFLMALVLILVLVAVSLGTTLGARVLLLPNLMPIAITLGGMALLEMPVNQSTAVIGVVALGIAVDGTVHLLDAAIRSRRIHGDGDAGIVLGLETAGRPIIITGAVVIAGFLVLMASDFRIVSELGGLIASTMALCLVADLILVPAQLFAIAGSGESGHRTALLVFGDSAHVAINLESSAHDGTFRLIGAEARWRGTPTGDVSIHWLRESGVTTGKLAGYDDIAIPVLRVRWSQKEVAGGGA
jgi:uncharacterized membrane protein YdfJ with MMPL/SSD domain